MNINYSLLYSNPHVRVHCLFSASPTLALTTQWPPFSNEHGVSLDKEPTIGTLFSGIGNDTKVHFFALTN
jgi:hypothetical protein